MVVGSSNRFIENFIPLNRWHFEIIRTKVQTRNHTKLFKGLNCVKYLARLHWIHRILLTFPRPRILKRTVARIDPRATATEVFRKLQRPADCEQSVTLVAAAAVVVAMRQRRLTRLNTFARESCGDGDEYLKIELFR